MLMSLNDYLYIYNIELDQLEMSNTYLNIKPYLLKNGKSILIYKSLDWSLN